MGVWIFFTIICVGIVVYAVLFLNEDKHDKSEHA